MSHATVSVACFYSAPGCSSNAPVLNHRNLFTYPGLYASILITHVLFVNHMLIGTGVGRSSCSGGNRLRVLT